MSLLFAKAAYGATRSALGRIPREVWVVLLVALLVGLYGHWRYKAGQADIQLGFDMHLVADQLAYDQAVIDAAAKEAKQAEAITAIVEEKRIANDKLIQDRDRTIADLRSGVIKLRQRFKCKASSLPGSPASPAGSDEAGEGGLRDEDAEFLVRFASDADAVAIQANACSAILLGERE